MFAVQAEHPLAAPAQLAGIEIPLKVQGKFDPLVDLHVPGLIEQTQHPLPTVATPNLSYNNLIKYELFTKNFMHGSRNWRCWFIIH